MIADEKKRLEDAACDIRVLTIDAIGNLGVGHIGGAMSIVEVLTVLYMKHLKHDPKNSRWDGRDRLVLSKGHAGPALYSTLAYRGFFEKEMLYTLNRGGTRLPSHCDRNLTPGIDMTTGSLGQGFSAATGIALALRMNRNPAKVYTIIGDGESNEGQIWEAAMFAAQQNLDNLIAFTDYNKMQIDGMTHEVNDLGDIEGKWKSFGWHVFRVDGHDVEAIDAAISAAKQISGKPAMIILDTIKGKGVSFCEGSVGSHNMTFDTTKAQEAINKLKEAR